MKDWSMPAYADSVWEVKAGRPSLGETSRANSDSPNPPTIERESAESVSARSCAGIWPLLALMIYLVVEYSRLPEMYPVLAGLPTWESLDAIGCPWGIWSVLGVARVADSLHAVLTSRY